MSSLGTDVLVIGGVLGITGVICAALYSIHKVATKIETVIGVDPKGRTIMDRMTRVEYQLWPNGGESLADKVTSNIAAHENTAKDVGFIKDVILEMLAVDTGKSKSTSAEAIALIPESTSLVKRKRTTKTASPKVTSKAS